MKRVLVIIPAYNEEANIETVVRMAMKHADVCVVNDGSRDRTRAIVESIEGAHLVNHEKNTHIPGAVMDGMRFALEHGYEAGIAMDAGMSHDPDAIPDFIAAMDGHDVVMGMRVRKVETPLYRRFLSGVGNFLYNYALDPSRIVWKRASFKDATSGYRLYSRTAMELILSRPMESRSFDFIIEALMYCYRNGLSTIEIPIEYRFTGSSLNRKVVLDAIRMLRIMIFSRRK